VTNLETIEANIKEIEAKLNHESHSLQDENKLHQKLQQLTAARPLAREHAVLQQKLTESDSYRSGISQRLADCDEVLKEIKDKETAEKSALEELRGKVRRAARPCRQRAAHARGPRLARPPHALLPPGHPRLTPAALPPPRAPPGGQQLQRRAGAAHREEGVLRHHRRLPRQDRRDPRRLRRQVQGVHQARPRLQGLRARAEAAAVSGARGREGGPACSAALPCVAGCRRLQLGSAGRQRSPAGLAWPRLPLSTPRPGLAAPRRWEARKAEREARDAERKKEGVAAVAAVDPFEEQVRAARRARALLPAALALLPLPLRTAGGARA
jgi:hypothetical protein